MIFSDLKTIKTLNPLLSTEIEDLKQIFKSVLVKMTQKQKNDDNNALETFLRNSKSNQTRSHITKCYCQLKKRGGGGDPIFFFWHNFSSHCSMICAVLTPWHALQSPGTDRHRKKDEPVALVLRAATQTIKWAQMGFMEASSWHPPPA